MPWDSAQTIGYEPPTSVRQPPLQRKVDGIADAIAAGWQGSATGLMLRGELPSIVLDPPSSRWYERAAAGITQVLAEMPQMIVGGVGGAAAGSVVGAPGGPAAAVGALIGGGAGSFAVPAAMRTALVESYSKGEVANLSDFLSRANIVLTATGKEAALGGATMGLGAYAKGAMAAAMGGKALEVGAGLASVTSRAGQAGVTAAARATELGTMVTGSALLHGKMPELMDFMDAAIVLGGVHASLSTARALGNTYAKTGIRPERVVLDSEIDPHIKLDLKPVETAIRDGEWVDAYHGSPYEFTKFDMSKIGSGEGGAAYGHGIYIAEIPETAKKYSQDALRRKPTLGSLAEDALYDIAHHWRSNGGVDAFVTFAKEAGLSKREIDQTVSAINDTGNLYRVQVPKAAVDRMIDWDKPLSEQPKNVVDAVAALNGVTPDAYRQMMLLDPYKFNKTGKELYQLIANGRGQRNAGGFGIGQEAASKRLQELGIPGIQYLDAGSRSAGEGTRNFVLFDADTSRVVERNGVKIEQPGGAGGGKEPPPNTPTGGESIPPSEPPRKYEPLRINESVKSAMMIDPKTNEQFAIKVTEAMRRYVSGEAELPQTKEPNHVNLRWIENVDEFKALLYTITSDVFGKEIEQARGGTKTWAESSAEAQKVMESAKVMFGKDGVSVDMKGMSLDAQTMSHMSIAEKAVWDLKQAAKAVADRGAQATKEDMAELSRSTQMMYASVAMAQGHLSEVARALNAAKAGKQFQSLAEQIKSLESVAGDPYVFANMVGRLDTTAKMINFANKWQAIGPWEKFIEAWKAGILSGPITHTTNMLSNALFGYAVRPLVDLAAAGTGLLRGNKDRILFSEVAYGQMAQIAGIVDGAKAAWEFMKAGENTKKVEQHRKGIGGEVYYKASEKAQAEGVKYGTPEFRTRVEEIIGELPLSERSGYTVGEIVRTPFRFLGAEDQFFRTTSERYTAYSLAARQASKEGFNPLTREFRERVATIVRDATPESDFGKAVTEAGDRYTFNTHLGSAGTKLQALVKASHTEMIMPFIQTPINIIQEVGRMTPFAPLVKAWREDISRGGASRDRALAEVGTGLAAFTFLFNKAMDGDITGQLDPDPNKRRAQITAGIQPYSWKIDNKYYSYQRLAPVGILLGWAADMAVAKDYVDEENMDKMVKVMSIAFANAFTNQTFLQGVVGIINALSDPNRYGEKWFEQFAGSVVPSMIAQTVTQLDPVQREVDGIMDAIKARLPGMRETLRPKRDVFGDTLATKPRGLITPITVTTETEDLVKSEAARLGISVAPTPKKLILNKMVGKVGEIKMTPAQRDKYAEEGGAFAYKIMSGIVNSPSWETMPAAIKTKIFQDVFKGSHRLAAMKAVPMDQRMGVIGDIAGAISEAMQPELVE